MGERWLTRRGGLRFAVAFLGAIALLPAAAAQTLTVFAAGSLGRSFSELARAFEAQHPGVSVRAQYGGSVKMVRLVTDLHQRADVVAVADAAVIDRYLLAGPAPKANWSIAFAGNALTFAYTDHSRGAARINASNWWQVLCQPGVQIGRSNPDTDPSGYQTLQMLQLAARYYRQPGLPACVLAHAPPRNMRDTETDLIAALQLGQIDYLAIYRSDAVQHHLRWLALPPQIDLSDPALAAHYAQARVSTAHGELTARPIVYALTIPRDAPQPRLAAEFVAMLLGPQGQQLLRRNGFSPLHPAQAQHRHRLPPALQTLTVDAPH